MEEFYRALQNFPSLLCVQGLIARQSDLAQAQLQKHPRSNNSGNYTLKLVDPRFLAKGFSITLGYSFPPSATPEAELERDTHSFIGIGIQHRNSKHILCKKKVYIGLFYSAIQFYSPKLSLETCVTCM